jgi:hypothetical protein
LIGKVKGNLTVRETIPAKKNIAIKKSRVIGSACAKTSVSDVKDSF